MTDAFSTGIDVLDRKLDGGIPVGQVVALSAPPSSQSELFLYDLAAERPTVYLTTERTGDATSDALTHSGVDPTAISIQSIGDDDPLAQATRIIQELPNRSNCIIDPVGLLERQDETAYRTFLNRLKAQTVETESVSLLHCLDGRYVSRARDITEYVADIVFDLTREQNGETIEYTLSVPKFRGGTALEETITLHLAADVSIDVSRKIA